MNFFDGKELPQEPAAASDAAEAAVPFLFNRFSFLRFWGYRLLAGRGGQLPVFCFCGFGVTATDNTNLKTLEAESLCPFHTRFIPS